MPLGRSLGIRATKAKAPVPNKELELAYTKNAKLNHKLVSENFKIFSDESQEFEYS